MQTIFDLQDVSYTYLEKFEALKNVNLTIPQESRFAIMGANGSGKSTLLSILNALVYPMSGEFYAFGNTGEGRGASTRSRIMSSLAISEQR